MTLENVLMRTTSCIESDLICLQSESFWLVIRITGKGMLIEEAVTKTWTAEQARAAGYPKATIVGKPVGTPGNYTEVQVLFQK